MLGMTMLAMYYCCSRALYEGLKVAATSDLMLAYMDFFLGGDEKRSDMSPCLHQRFPIHLKITFGPIISWLDVYANPKLATYGVRVDLASCQPTTSGYCQFGLVVHTTENENKSSSLPLSRLVRWYFMKFEHRRVHCSGMFGLILFHFNSITILREAKGRTVHELILEEFRHDLFMQEVGLLPVFGF
ncbi:hypothetical protein KIW84_012856 [Lathyrus oleraceus]|uniref:Uncharacterized protein n=1 Tax=Pisum sativum TaxID=3888 RepID=A0A9D5BIN6_PEA|nr:hypothetical protein KIW84_012856 [Pisum sativum]